jgi:DNA sulfur modification protein DndD
MIITRLVVHNFGTYRGRFELNLKPPTPSKPVVLFGGLNGGGKTTLLDALQLVLYGKFAQCSNRGTLNYEEFLRRSIHRNVPPSEGAAIEIEFTHTTEGKEQTYCVLRAWSVRESGVREHLEVYRGEGPKAACVHDPVLSESWSEQIEEFIPVRLSKFFFFDGEKIETLANLEESRDVLATAIRALLGLDLVDQLATDLVVLERRKRALQKSVEEQQALASLQQEAESIRERRTALFEQRGHLQSLVDRAKVQAERADHRFKLGGGEAYERRREYEVKRDGLAVRTRGLEGDLEEVAAGMAPLLLAGDLLDEVLRDAVKERHGALAHEVVHLLAERDAHTVEMLKRAGVVDSALARVTQFLNADRSRRTPDERERRYLNFSLEGYDELAAVQPARREALTDRVRRQVDQVTSLQTELEELDRTLASVPDAEAIAQLALARIEATQAVDARETELKLLDVELEQVKRDHDAKWAALTKVMEKAVEEQHHQEELARLIEHSEGIRVVLGRFRIEVLKRHIARIERLVLEGFRHLLRKQGLVAALRIDPTTFALTLLDDEGRDLPPERLSAGERQLLAVAILWGVARASGRVLPVAIDTPLGRLDSTHRSLLVDRYFPHASHQVFLFSTDEEIDEALYARLKPYIGHTYLLSYDDKRRASTIEEGYLW